MNLKELQERGGFVPAAPVKKSIVWKTTDEKTGAEEEVAFDIFVRKLSFGMVESLVKDPDGKSRNATLISLAVGLGDDGKESLSYTDAYQLKPSLANAMVIAIVEVNALPKPNLEGEDQDDPKD